MGVSLHTLTHSGSDKGSRDNMDDSLRIVLSTHKPTLGWRKRVEMIWMVLSIHKPTYGRTKVVEIIGMIIYG